jgi:predicted glycosyltransferase involved in capsule biosynthesis
MNIILIPYRNREIHLNHYLRFTVPLLEEIMKEVKILVIEQTDEKPFNRGKLLNIGFDYMKDRGENFYTHDVDINPNKRCVEEIYMKDLGENSIMGIFTSKHKTLGGIIKFKRKVFEKINGFPNNFWGWGVEDKALQNRAEYYDVNISKNITTDDEKRYNYFLRFDDIDDREKLDQHKKWYNEYKRFGKLEKKEEYIKSSGLNTLKYELLDETRYKNIETIKVRI